MNIYDRDSVKSIANHFWAIRKFVGVLREEARRLVVEGEMVGNKSELMAAIKAADDAVWQAARAADKYSAFVAGNAEFDAKQYMENESAKAFFEVHPHL